MASVIYVMKLFRNPWCFLLKKINQRDNGYIGNNKLLEVLIEVYQRIQRLVACYK